MADSIPGTEDLAHDRHGKGDNDIVLVPRPSTDVHDPLNWSRTWKYLALGNMLYFMFLGNFTTLSIAPLTPIFMEYFNTSVSRVAALTGACILSLGYANLLIIPCANIFGRRPVALICCLICVASHIWQASSKSYSSFLGGRVLVGIGASTSESLMPVVISDIMFLHERGTWMGAYFWAYFMGAWIGPIVSGSIGADVSWQWFFWLSTILQGVSFLTMLIAFPETKYHRTTEGYSIERVVGLVPPQGEANSGLVSKKSDGEKQSITAADGSEAVQYPNLVGDGYPSLKQRWGIVGKLDMVTFKNSLREFLTPLYLAFFPIVLFGALCVTFGASCLLVLNLVQSQAFSRTPYNFEPQAVGFTNFALMAGGIIGLATAGPVSDWTSMALTRRNNGIREPEMRLFSFIPFIIICVIGMLISALGMDRFWSWESIVMVGFGFTGIIVVAIPTIGTTYAIDSYKPAAGEIMVVATIGKNSFGYGMTYFINPWLEKNGFIPPIITVGMLTVGIALVGLILFYFFGKACRKLTRNSIIHKF
ncbi:serine/threonine kinase 16 [Xylogone sp. PMI_703]|nr:serine/threonine kinase 16 [Xylogone sp. PMI_703]